MRAIVFAAGSFVLLFVGSFAIAWCVAAVTGWGWPTSLVVVGLSMVATRLLLSRGAR